MRIGIHTGKKRDVFFFPVAENQTGCFYILLHNYDNNKMQRYNSFSLLEVIRYYKY